MSATRVERKAHISGPVLGDNRWSLTLESLYLDDEQNLYYAYTKPLTALAYVEGDNIWGNVLQAFDDWLFAQGYIPWDYCEYLWEDNYPGLVLILPDEEV